LKKLAALNPKDIGNKEKIAEAEKLVQVVGKQMNDAETQQMKVEEELKTTLAKAQQASINSAKAKASAEASFRAMVISNNRVCNLCEHGKEKIAKRRAEIAGAIREETKRKAERMARRHSEKEQRKVTKAREVAVAAGKSLAQVEVAGPTQPAPTVNSTVAAPKQSFTQVQNSTTFANATANTTAATYVPVPALAQREIRADKHHKKSHKSAKKAKQAQQSDAEASEDDEEAFDQEK